MPSARSGPSSSIGPTGSNKYAHTHTTHKFQYVFTCARTHARTPTNVFTSISPSTTSSHVYNRPHGRNVRETFDASYHRHISMLARSVAGTDCPHLRSSIRRRAFNTQTYTRQSGATVVYYYQQCDRYLMTVNRCPSITKYPMILVRGREKSTSTPPPPRHKTKQHQGPQNHFRTQ